MSNQTDDFLAESASHPALTFELNTVHKGRVVDVRKKVDTQPDGTTKTWPNGDPMHVFVFDLDTADGMRSMWVRGNLVKVLKEAAAAAGVSTMIGTTITVQHNALGEAKRGFSPAKLYRAKVEPAPPAADDFTAAAADLNAAF